VTFRTQATADLSTFVNVDEFGVSVDIDGNTVVCVLEDEENPSSGDGVTSRESNLYARASQFFKYPEVGNRITITEAEKEPRQANVVRVAEEQELLILRLRWFES